MSESSSNAAVPPAVPLPAPQDVVVNDANTGEAYTLANCIALSNSAEPQEQLLGAQLLAVLSKNARSEQSLPSTLCIIAVGGVRSLVRLLGSPVVDVQAHACRAQDADRDDTAKAGAVAGAHKQ